ncbi:MAG: isoleucine--tRNA ligase [Candidatus Aenigmarchaeota archaeon]|nr:isoleucine--tRNA ligase [Candidatus Aenigmarchaeota archaeon]MDW8149175.1 isoleucine--tRNA ligase [Candidatus Aenigmarchaeota archaeon]
MFIKQEESMLDLKKIENEIKEYWEKNKIIEKLTYFKKGKRTFFLLDGPPYVNATPHVGHIKTIVFKDVWSKFYLMNRLNVIFQPGFDCHGLPIENIVERELQIKTKKEIENFGVERFIELCRQKASGNEKIWLEVYRKIGAWRGYFKPYLTLENYYIQSAWYVFKKIFEKGLVYHGERAYFWCPRCETALSGYEVTDSYADVLDPHIFVKFPLKGKEKEYVLVFTTTPWTLLSNVAIAVHPNEKYVKVEYNGEKLILAEKRIEYIFKELLKDENYRVIEVFEGKSLEGLEYLPLIDCPLQQKINFRKIILSIPILKSKSYKHGVLEKSVEMKGEFFDFVNVNEGSGVVHVAPGHGQEDYYIAQHYNLPAFSPVDNNGKFTEEAGKFNGMFVKDADKLIIEELKNKNLLLYFKYITHSYPLCWRCKSYLIFRLTKQWFISVDKIKEKMLSENEKVKWLPSFAKDRFRNWVKDAIDWCISRQRFWGIPIPVWICESCNQIIVIGSVDELLQKAIDVNVLDDLHKHVVDKIIIKCNACGGKAKRIPDIFDVWYDSGVAPFASIGYPFLTKKFRIVDLIDESQDQIRGWFYTLMFVSVAFIDKAPYKTVCMNGWVLDEKGEKMSKSLGNVIDASYAIEKIPVDVLRFYYCYGNAPWEQQNFSFKVIDELRRQFNIFLNCFEFFKMYKHENWKFSLENLEIEDLWILSKVNTLIKNSNRYIKNFEFNKFGKSFLDFVVNDLSRFYIKKIRDRVWIYAEEKSKNAAISTLYYVIISLVKLLAPIAPFISEKIYLEIGLDKKESIFEERYPKVDKKFINKKLEREMEEVKKIINNVLSLREKAKIKLRWPLKKIVVKTRGKKIKNLITNYGEIIKNMCNAKEIVFVKKFEDKNYVGEELEKLSIYIPITLDEEIKKEAFLRELIRNIQENRKKLKLKVDQKVDIYLDKKSAFIEIIESNIEKVCKEVNASTILIKENLTECFELDFENKKIYYKIIV